MEKQALSLMGTDFEITVVTADKQSASAAIELAIGEIRRIEALISSWDPKSQTSEINRQAGESHVKVDVELFDLIERSLNISRLTDGAFDISFAGVDKIWHFDGTEAVMPSAQTISESVEKIGFAKILLDHESSSVMLQDKGMKISFGAIGKGYAADCVRILLKNHGVAAGIINASGDLAAWGEMPGGKPWKVAITNPLNKETAFGLLPILEGAVVTSGNYEKYTLIDDIRYSHIVDPRTGLPTTGILSATVFAPSAELADALATGLFVMGIESGIDRINQINGVECLIVDEHGNLHQSNQIKLETEQ